MIDWIWPICLNLAVCILSAMLIQVYWKKLNTGTGKKFFYHLKTSIKNDSDGTVSKFACSLWYKIQYRYHLYYNHLHRIMDKIPLDIRDKFNLLSPLDCVNLILQTGHFELILIIQDDLISFIFIFCLHEWQSSLLITYLKSTRI